MVRDAQLEGRVGKLPISAAGRTLALGFALSLAACLAASAGMESKWPPDENPLWTATWLLATFAIILALRASKAGDGARAIGWGAFLTIGLASLGYLTACFFRYESWHELPWIAFGLWVVGLTVSSWIGRQRVWTVLTPLVALAWVGPGLRGPITPSPALFERGDLILKASTVPRDDTTRQGISLELKTVSGRPLSSEFDLRNVRITGSAGPLLDVTCWPPMDLTFEETESPHSVKSLHASTFVPEWVRSWDVRIVVPMWPEHSAGHLRMPVPKKNGETIQAKDQNCAQGFAVTGLTWSTSKEIEVADGLVIRVESSVFGRHGLDEETFRSLRVRDDLRQVTDFSVKDQGGGYLLIKLDPVSSGAKWLEIDLYTKAQRDAADLVFKIPRFDTHSAERP